MRQPRKYVCPRCPGVVCFNTDRELRGHLGGKHGRVIAYSAIEHGTISGYKKEQRRQMRTCKRCKKAWATYIRNRRAVKGDE